MKNVLASLVILATVSASAATVYVNDSVFTAAGAGSANYNKNVNQIASVFSEKSGLAMGQLRFAGATVGDAGVVRYTFHALESSENRMTCWAYLQFTTSPSENGPKVSDISAEQKCTKEQD